MKFQLNFKTPDVLDQFVQDELGGMREKLEDYEKFLKQWIEFSEYVTLEFDTDANTCVVLQRK